MNINFVDSIKQIKNTDWQRLNASSCPFLNYDFFKALEDSGSASTARGWQPHHLHLSDKHEINAIMPMYLKKHSWGEYVFDWDWAEAFKRHGYQYYPKLVSTIPFTPVTSNKLLSTTFDHNDIFELLTDHCRQQSINSWHLLYCPKTIETLKDVYERNTVQFHWFNRNYGDFEDFISTFTSRKRKNTRKERLSIKQQEISIRQLTGSQITTREIDFFYLTYQLTYLKRGHTPHLSYEFFKQICNTSANNILLIIASHQQTDVACSLFFYDQAQLYGRYWGCSQSFNNLHFELCYYQAIEFCIKHKLQCFNPGTQGEHKIQRGFEPILTHSYHWIKNPVFQDAIKDFCQQERQHMQKYQLNCQQALPFKQPI